MEVTDRRRVTRNRPVELAWSTRRNLLCINDFHPTGRRGRDSAGRGPSLSRCPPGGSLRSYDPQPSGLKALVSVSATRRPRASSCPPYDENSQLLSQPAVGHIFAERARFELAIPFWGTHAFQACLFSHSSISPLEHLSNTYPGPFGQNRTAKVIIFSGSASTGGSIFPRGAIKSGCGRCNRGILRGNG